MMVLECQPTFFTRSLFQGILWYFMVFFWVFYGIYFDILCQGQWNSRYPPPSKGGLNLFGQSVKVLTFFWLGRIM